MGMASHHDPESGQDHGLEAVGPGGAGRHNHGVPRMGMRVFWKLGGAAVLIGRTSVPRPDRPGDDVRVHAPYRVRYSFEAQDGPYGPEESFKVITFRTGLVRWAREGHAGRLLSPVQALLASRYPELFFHEEVAIMAEVGSVAHELLPGWRQNREGPKREGFLADP